MWADAIQSRRTRDDRFDPFDHLVLPKFTHFRMDGDRADVTIQDVYAALVTDEARNESIVRDVIHAVESGRHLLS